MNFYQLNSGRLVRYTMVFVLIFFSGVHAAKVEKIIQNVQKKFKSSQTLRIQFVETARFSLTGTQSQVSGILQMEGNDRFRLESEDQVVVNDGETLWRYDKLENQVLVDYAKKGDQEVMISDFLDGLEDHYLAQMIDEVKDDNLTKYVIKLTPKPSQQSYFSSIKIWVRDKSWTVDRVIYMDYNDNETEYTIENMEFNPLLTQAVFTFTPPEGIQVIDLRF